MANPGLTPRLQALIGKAIQHQQRGEYARAEEIYAEVLKQDPQQPDSHHYLGLLAHQTGRSELAESHVRRSIELAPQRADFHFNYANLLLNLGRPEQAVQELQRTTELAPGMLSAWLALGTVLQGLSFHMHAAACFHRVLSAEPQRADVWQSLGACMRAENMLPEAAEAYRRAQALVPADPHVQLALAGIAMDGGHDEEATQALRKLLEMAPTLPDAHYQHAVWHANRGDFEAARAELERTLELAPDHFQAALYYTYITPLTPDAPLVRRLDEVARAGGVEPAQAANVHFALGYVLDKDRRYDAAFGHYLEANRLQRSLSRYSTESQLRLQASLQAAFGKEFLDRAKAFSNPSAKPLFIMGMPRSGTSLLEQILASHPEVAGGGEMRLLSAELRRHVGPSSNAEFGQAVAALPAGELADVAAKLAAQFETLAPGKRHLTDKMPSNFMYLGLIHALFPEAHIIHCRRDALDTCVSCFTTCFREGQRFTNDLKELGEYYRMYLQAMDFWGSILPPGTIHEVRYEELVEDLEGQTRRLLEACGLYWDPACLHFQDNARPVSTASVYQVRQPIYRSAVGRWQRYAAHLGPLQEALSTPALL